MTSLGVHAPRLAEWRDRVVAPLVVRAGTKRGRVKFRGREAFSRVESGGTKEKREGRGGALGTVRSIIVVEAPTVVHPSSSRAISRFVSFRFISDNHNRRRFGYSYSPGFRLINLAHASCQVI